MVSTFTPNIQIEEPARGDDVGTWDTPVNSNMTVLDLVAGAINTISLNNSPVVLSVAQFRSKQITFNSTLTGSVAITFPSTFTKSYEIQNVCTGSSAFVITLGTTVAGGQVICCPPGETIDCFNDGVNLKYKNFGRVGTYWDYAGSSVPAWVSGCSVAPYLNCDGSTFSATTFPSLAVILNSTTLPNSKGSFRATMNQGSGLLTSSVGGIDGNTLFARGGVQATTLSSLHVPKLVDVQHGHPGSSVNSQNSLSGTPGPFNTPSVLPQAGSIAVAFTGLVYGSSTQTAAPTVPPAYIGGLTLIRSA